MAKRRGNNEGSIFWDKSKERWCAEITLPDGRRKRKRNKSKKVVQEWLLEQRKNLQEGRLPINENVTLASYLDQFLQDVVQHTLKPKTASSYTWLINKHIKPEIGKKKLASLKSHHIQALYSEKLNSGLSSKTVHHIHSVLRRALNQAVSWELIYRNPCDGVTPPRIEKKVPVVWSADQAKIFLDTVKEHSYYPIYLIALTTGARRGEILGLEWKNLSFTENAISIQKTIQEVSGKTVVGTPKTSGSRRKLTLPPITLDALKEHQNKTKQTEGFIFTTSVGTPISPRNLLRHFYKAIDQANLPRIRFHDLRHTFATLMLSVDGGVHPKVVQEMLGHSSITQTLDTYSHVIPGIKQEAAEKINTIFAEG
ncbi:MAG: hypothetical protein CL608_04460 [Anaerolineaceae bacterium]|nr:hypothetical protein [Anaerolineaceae bacterium]